MNKPHLTSETLLSPQMHLPRRRWSCQGEGVTQWGITPRGAYQRWRFAIEAKRPPGAQTAPLRSREHERTEAQVRDALWLLERAQPMLDQAARAKALWADMGAEEADRTMAKVREQWQVERAARRCIPITGAPSEEEMK